VATKNKAYPLTYKLSVEEVIVPIWDEREHAIYINYTIPRCK